MSSSCNRWSIALVNQTRTDLSESGWQIFKNSVIFKVAYSLICAEGNGMRIAVAAGLAVLLIVAVFAITWAGSNDFGTRQAVEFFPYDDELTLDSGETIRASGVMVLVNDYLAAPTDQDMANLMQAAYEMYPDECSGINWEIAVRRPDANGREEKYSYSVSAYEIGGPGSWIEIGYWTGDNYVVRQSYEAAWVGIDEIAHGEAQFRIDVE